MELLRQVLLGLWTFLNTYMEFWVRAVAAVGREFDMNMSPEVADLVGISVGALIGLAFLRRLTMWDRRGNKPQEFPIRTTQTPDEVVSEDSAQLLGVFVKVALFVFVVLIFGSSR